MRFAVGAALAQGLDAALVGCGEWHGQPLREKVVAGITGGHFDQVGFAAQAHDILN